MTQTGSDPARHAPSLSRGQVWVNLVLRFVYFGRVRVVADPSPDHAENLASDHPAPARLIISSHRNGAIDGHQVLAAFPHAEFLISIQLVRNWFMRLFFSGIPVVRPKDVERYGLDPASVASPVDAACAHLRAGGELGIFPEGSSEWGFAPQEYKSGAARIACTLIDEGVDLEVIPLGLFYSNPDTFRSRAEVVRGRPITIPDRAGRDRREWESAIASALSEALDSVSVNCPDQATFDRIQTQALRAAQADSTASFAEAFLAGQRQAWSGAGQSQTPSDSSPAPSAKPLIGRVSRWFAFALMWLVAPILLLGGLAGTRADGRNTVTFFRMLGGSLAAMVWVPALIVATIFWPLVVGVGVVCAVCGWLLLGVTRFRL